MNYGYSLAMDIVFCNTNLIVWLARCVNAVL